MAAAVEVALGEAGDEAEGAAVSVQPETLTTITTPGSEVDYGGDEDSPTELIDTKDEEAVAAAPEARFEPGAARSPSADASADLPASGSADSLPEPIRHLSKPAYHGGPVRLGTAKVRLLQELARADTANWKGLTQALKEAEGAGGAKAELVDDLTRLADLRRQAAAATTEALRDEVKRVQGLEENDREYLRALEERGDEMLRLERLNPVRPSQNSRRIESARLTAEIEAGVGVWVARRREKGRLRAQQHRAQLSQDAARERAVAGPTAEPLSLRESAEARAAAARREIAEFKAWLAREGDRGVPLFRRAPDSKRRRAVKRERQRQRARSGAPTDDATRDTNHAIAHRGGEQCRVNQTPAGSVGGPPQRGEAWWLDWELGLLAILSLVGLYHVLRHVDIWSLPGRRALPGLSGGPSEAPRAPWDERQGDATGPRPLARVASLGPAPGRVQVRAVPDPARRDDHWHVPGCPLGTAPVALVPPCKDCRPIPGPGSTLTLTRAGRRVHQGNCGHVLGRRRRTLRPCPECVGEGGPTGSSEGLGPSRVDDAQRDTNHATAHASDKWETPALESVCLPETRFESGITLPNNFGVGILLALFLAAASLLGVFGACILGGGDPPEHFEAVPAPARSRRVGRAYKPKQVRFAEPLEGERPEELLRRGQPAVDQPKARGLVTLGLRLKSRQDYDDEALAVALDRLALTTRRTYENQLRWWRLFCRRRGVPWLLSGGTEAQADEQLLIDYLLHSAVNEHRAPGTLKLRLAAVRSVHLSLGLNDPLEGRGRITMALAGLRRRYKVPERRAPVTPRMLQWLHTHLHAQGQEGSLMWAIVALGFFFLLRASEVLPLGYISTSRQLKGENVLLYSRGVRCGLQSLREADEVQITLKGSKTHYNLETSRNHHATGEVICPVSAVVELFSRFPLRYDGQAEAALPLFRTSAGEPIGREALQMTLRKAAEACGVGGRLGSHSLRFGGASALWAAYKDAAVVRRYGRWSSDAFHIYLWEDRGYSSGMAKAMVQADLAPT